MMTCSKLYVTKIKYSKSLQSQRTKGRTETSFNFTVILCNRCPRKFYIRRNNKKVDSIETRRIVIAHFLP